MGDGSRTIIKRWACSWAVQIRKQLMRQIKDANWIMSLIQTPKHFSFLSQRGSPFISVIQTLQEKAPSTSRQLPFIPLTFCQQLRHVATITLKPVLSYSMPLSCWHTTPSPKMAFPKQHSNLPHKCLPHEGISPQNLYYPSQFPRFNYDFVCAPLIL